MSRTRVRNGSRLRLAADRWSRVSRRHPEIRGMRLRVLETLGDPDLVRRGDAEEIRAYRLLKRTPVGSRYLTVVYREAPDGEGSVVTAYLTPSPTGGREVVWRR